MRVHSTVAPLRTIVLFYSSNNVNALNGHHPKKTALKSLPLVMDCMEATQGTSTEAALTVTLRLKDFQFHPVDLGGHDICTLLYAVCFSKRTWFEC